jgi:hypothetical protein
MQTPKIKIVCDAAAKDALSCQTGTALNSLCLIRRQESTSLQIRKSLKFCSCFCCTQPPPLSKHGWDEKTEQAAITLLTPTVFFRTQSGLICKYDRPDESSVLWRWYRAYLRTVRYNELRSE